MDKSLFHKTLNLAAATVHDPRNISKYRKQMQKSSELLGWERLDSCREDPVEKGKKCLLLKPGVQADGQLIFLRVWPYVFWLTAETAPSTWGSVVKQGVEVKELSVIPFDVQLDYDYWSYSKCRS